MKKEKQQVLISLFDQAITDVGAETELGQFLAVSKAHVLDKTFKGIELMAISGPNITYCTQESNWCSHIGNPVNGGCK